MNRQTSQNNTDFERLVRKDVNGSGGLSQRMGVPMNAMEVDSDLSDIDEELNENARYGIGMGVNGNQGAQRGHPQIQQQQMNYGGQQQQQRYGPGQGGPPNQHGFSQQLPVNPSRAASLNGPPQQQQMHAQNPHMQQQQQQQQQQGPTPQPPQKKSLFSFGKKKQDDHQNHGPQPFSQQPQQIQPMGRPIADPQVTDVNRQKRMSMEKRLSMDQKRMSMDKRGSLEIKLHDGMIIVDEEERKILARKYGSNPSNITTSPTGANVITHNQVQNHFPGGPPPRVLSSPQQQPGMMAPPMPGPGNFDPRMRPPPGMSGPPFNPNMQGSPNSRPMPLGSGPMPGGFQGPPRTGSLNSPPQFSQQYQRPPPPTINQKPSPFMPQQQQQAYSMQQQQPLPPQRLSYMGNSVQGGTPPLNLGMPGSQPFRPLPSGPNGPPQPLQLNLRHSPMLFDPLQPIPSGADQRFVPQQLPQPPQRMPLASQGPPPQSMPGSMKTAPFEKTPPVIQEEASQQQPQQPQQQQQDLQTQQQQQQFTKVDDEDEEYYDDDESVGSFISFDEVTEDNTEYNAIVDYDLLDAVMGGSTDYDALLPRVVHDRKVVFGALVKASTLVRVLADGELLQEGADPDGDTEFETEGDEEDEDEDEEEEEDSDDGRPESPMTEVVSMIPLRPPDQEAAPEIMPRGVSLKLTEGGVAGVGVPGEGLFASMATVGALPAEQFAQQQQYQVPAVAAAVAASKVDRESSPQPPLEPEHESVLPGADTTQRKKVRHVQIQTRGATMKTQTTLTEIFGLEQDLDLGFTPDDILGAIEAGGMDASMIPGGNSGVDSAQVEEMESELAFLREQAAALHQAMAAMQAEAAAKQTEAEEKQARFDKLSGQAMRKIKELVAERKVMEIEIDSLRGQVKGLDELVQKWTLDAEEP